MNSKTAVRASAWVLETTSIEQLAFERGKEALRHRVVVGVADRPHRGAHARLPTSLAELDRGILRALIRMVDHAARPPLLERHVEGVEHDLPVQGARHRPAHDPTAERIEHDRQIEEASPGRNIRDIGHPKHIGLVRREVAVDEIGRPTRPIVTVGLRRVTPAAAVRRSPLRGRIVVGIAMAH